MIRNRYYHIQDDDDYNETYIGTLKKTSSIGPKEYEFNNVSKLEIIRTPNQTIIIPTKINEDEKIFRTGDYFELQEDGRKRKRRKSKSRKRKSRKRKSV
jgi:virulence-associated protein VagC